MSEFIGNIILRGKIECVTGLHIGAGKDTAEIGGVDSPVVRDPHSRLPYIPGSSLKGRLRALLEYAVGTVGKDKRKSPGAVHSCSRPDCPVCRILGSAAEEARTCGPTRILVRDAYPDAGTLKRWDSMGSELLYTEVKSENFLDRVTSAANPRFIERVIKGSVFDLEMVYGVYRMDEYDDLNFFDTLLLGLQLLEDSALGGSGSRGYGQVRLRFAPLEFRGMEDYRTGAVRAATPEPAAFTLRAGELRLDRNQEPLRSWSSRAGAGGDD